jgi:hypothetical protein
MDRNKTIGDVKQWMQLDAEIQALKRQARALEVQKKELTKQLVATMRDHEIDEFDLTDGKLVRQTQKTKTPLSRKYLADCFSKFFKGEDAHVKELSEVVFGAQKVKTVERIVCKKNK